ncbi:uncharacterized protein AB675_2256 [Cyphellophora attinorum]|uniref:Uncharacterized protein n=1 Tax=Cyphellophora attinorum TaxID=1664694 RepID=A0A0N1HGZ5_9EURO|nr:uncharacterized protein AB675_2256 [Phialophora attinorum]KPI34872.1 hypothetical protein AB675_2256 [Phialophora attinorum]
MAPAIEPAYIGGDLSTLKEDLYRAYCPPGWTGRFDWCLSGEKDRLTWHLMETAGRFNLYLSHLFSTTERLKLYRRDDTATTTPVDNDKQVQQSSSTAPALSPSAIVGIASLALCSCKSSKPLITYLFLSTTLQSSPPQTIRRTTNNLAPTHSCIASAAMLRYFTHTPDPTSTSSLYRPEDAGQLERMKEVREFNRAAAWERAEEARWADEQESERKRRERAMMSRVIAAGGGRRGTGSGSPPSETKEEWRKRMGMSAMEAQGGFDVDAGEQWPLGGGGGGRERETLLGGSRDYSDGAYLDVEESAGDASSGGSSDRKGKQVDRNRVDGLGGGDPGETRPLTAPPTLMFGGGRSVAPKDLQQRQRMEEEGQWQQASIKPVTPDYYD